MATTKKQGDENVLSEIKQMLAAYPSLSGKMPKDFDPKAIAGTASAFDASINEMKAMSQRRRQVRTTKAAQRRSLESFMKRVRSMVRGAFGDDSPEYVAVGGTPVSLRKPPVRKPKLAKAA